MMLCITVYLYSLGCSHCRQEREVMPVGDMQAWGARTVTGEKKGYLVWDIRLVWLRRECFGDR